MEAGGLERAEMDFEELRKCPNNALVDVVVIANIADSGRVVMLPAQQERLAALFTQLYSQFNSECKTNRIFSIITL